MKINASVFSSPPKSTVICRYVEFRRGHTSTEDASRSGCPKEVIIPEIIQKLCRMLLNNRKVNEREWFRYFA